MAIKRRNFLLVPLWLAAAGTFVDFAKRAAPLGVHDEVSYQVGYWLIVGFISAVLIVSGAAVVGKEFLRSIGPALARAAKWPRPATHGEAIVIVTCVVASFGAIPNVRRVLEGQGATFSRIEEEVMAWLFRPFLGQATRPWRVAALIGAFWLVTSLITSVAVAPIVRRSRLTPPTLAIAAGAAAKMSLVLLRMLSPSDWPP